MNVFLDSDVLIEITRGRDHTILARWDALRESDSQILFSPLSAAEVWSGAWRSEFNATLELFAGLQCVPAFYETGELAGEFLRRYAKSHGLELPDALIAASAHLNGAALWTRNRKHYPMRELTFY